MARTESFWNKLPRPFFVMAPMADVTDPAWRALVAKLGKPDITFTEFVSADGLYHTRESHVGHSMSYMADTGNPLMRDLQFTQAERPVVAQIFSAKPEMIAYAAKLVHELGFDGVDINMGCPDKSIEKQGCGAAMMRAPKLAQEVIRAAQEASPLPVSVKTRVGYAREALDEWLPALLETNPAAITLHLRTRKEVSAVPADWELMKKAVAIRDRIAPRDSVRGKPEVLLIGNGDVEDMEDAREKARASGADGVMLGRAVFGNPWLFEGISGHRMSSSEAGHTMSKHGLDEKLAALAELARAFEALRPRKNFSILKKHIKAFVADFDGAANLRARLMTADTAASLTAKIMDIVSP